MSDRSMTEIAHSIDLNLPQKLRDKTYRQKFFWAESCSHIAKQLIDLRKRRGLNQKQVAEMTGTKQPAISRFEQADYQNRNLNTLLSIADVLNARVRVLIEPFEDVLAGTETPSDGRPMNCAQE
jgi:DNA-binding XRE family transcriptional regulator